MRVCPKCGFKDPPEWRNLRFQLFTEYTEFESFNRLYPELAAALLENPKIVFDEHHAYHLTRSNHVHRLPKYMCFNGKWNHCC